MAAKKKPESPVKPQQKKEPIRTYGSKFAGMTQLFYDREAFARKASIDEGAPRRRDLLKRITDAMVPGWFEWHTWTDRTVESICESQFCGFAGAASTGKTRNISGIACAWWLCAPAESSVIYCSTTAKSLRKRGWAEVQNFHTSIPGPRLGNFVDSRMMWQAKPGDDRHAIVGIAVEEGDTKKVADNIKGIHTMRQMVIIDEATAVPEAIYDACTNLWSYPTEFILICIGNPRSRLDAFGKFCEPFHGWNSVTVDTEEWETKPKVNGKNGVVVRFDAEKSPNIIEGRIVSKHLPTKEKVEAARNRAGSQDDPTYWSNQRGFWPPEGITRTVFSETMIVSCDGYGRHKFTGNNFRIIGVLDPARTGDRPTLRFAALGETEKREMGLEIMPPIVIPVNASSKRPIDYQIVDYVKKEVQRVMYRGQPHICPPIGFGVDSTGGGADLCDIMNQEWSHEIQRIGFGESASNESCSVEDSRPANEVYRNRRVEMYFRAKSAMLTGQIKGLDAETAQELCSITYDNSKTQLTLIAKADYRKLYGKSPDLADCAVMILEVARKFGFKLSAQGESKNIQANAEEVHHKAQEVFASVDYSAEEEPAFD